MAVGDADRADVVALGEEQLEDGAAVLLEPLSIGADLHAFVDGGHAGGKELVAALDLNQAKAAGAHFAEAVHMAEGGNVDVVLPRHFKDGLAAQAADFLLIDDESFDVYFGAHANTSTGA